ncbi:cobyric acid synthase [Pelagibacterium xiamenense]|uniref:cobyric acid synthase n=1 Tax=Pelagibacterium xiamenense TaxID=2901140 RepID=UPI001E51986D|nr:cobyric acid synthase [Pelagibacterium xiamenense]MCD7058832.1 cobyric acid synthase [Pelagibacterium xiamenense]
MTARALMVMGTGSDVGKSLIVAGLCRALANRGHKVAPFKPQNMSNNAAVTADGGEIGRAQALQARAARKDLVTAMNPVLLKPERETGSQVVVRGRRVASMSAREYFAFRGRLMPDVLAAFSELAAENDFVLVEGAGSASEVNLRESDLANFGFAQAAGVPVVLVGDIHRGGVIASVVGTFAVVEPEDRALIAATLVNKFHGDPSLFDEGRRLIAEKTGVPCLGPVPHFPGAGRLPAEDVLALEGPDADSGDVVIAVLRLGRIANFDDLDPLRAEPGVRVVLVAPGEAIPREARLVIIPGSKATRADLEFVRAQGWDIDIAAHIRAGGHVLGICGGYQMLGRSVADPAGIEGARGESAGLGHLDVETVMDAHKQLRVEAAQDAVSGLSISGYHMHMGITRGGDTQRPFGYVAGAPEGARSADGRVMGTYLHGLFAADDFRRDFLARLGVVADPLLDYDAGVDATLDALAGHLEAHLDLDALFALARPVTT